MKMMMSNLDAIVADTLTDSIQMIDIAQLHDSADNFFTVDRIEELADAILGQGGVKDNLLVRPLDSGGYEIISGHRRCAAVRLLLDRGENVSRLLPCLVQNYADEDSRMLDLILMNVSARRLSDAELWKSYELLNSIFQKKREQGEKFGRLRETLADFLGVSSSQIGKLQNVERYAIPEVKEAVENGDLSISTANEIARLPEEEQQTIASGSLKEVKPKEIPKRSPIPADAPQASPETGDSSDEDEEVDTNVNFPDDAEEELEDGSEDEPEEHITSAEPPAFNFEKEKSLAIIKQYYTMRPEERAAIIDTGAFNTIIEGYLVEVLKRMELPGKRIHEAQATLRDVFDFVGADTVCRKLKEE